jgi:5-methylcytosine-specific restriction enzyme B
LVDHALRRRFAFLPLYPDFALLDAYHSKHGTATAGLIATLKQINDLIADPHYAVGVSYFLTPTLHSDLESIWRNEIEPYLEEHFFDRKQKLDQFRWDQVREKLLS